MDEKILQTIEDIRKDINQKLDILAAQVIENKRTRNKESIETGNPYKRREIKIKASNTRNKRIPQNTKPLIVKVDYDPKKDFAIIAFKEKIRRIEKGK